MLLVKKGDQMRRLTKGLLPFLVVIGVLDLLVVLEPDLSVAIMYTLVAGIVLFAGGVRIGHFVVLGMIGIPVLWHEMERLQYVLLRMVTFLDPGSPAAETKYQLGQSLIAVGSGGFLGRGLAKAASSSGSCPSGTTIHRQQHRRGMGLLRPHDAHARVRRLRVARVSNRALGAIAISAARGHRLTVTVVTTAFLHIGVVVGLLPTTGLTLPFISYGRSNLVLSLFMTGMLVNIGSTKERVHGVAATDPLRRRPGERL
jgi:cell division protein FtsW